MGLPMKTAEWHQQGHCGDFIVNLKKKIHLFTTLRLDKWISDERLLSENLLSKQAI